MKVLGNKFSKKQVMAALLTSGLVLAGTLTPQLLANRRNAVRPSEVFISEDFNLQNGGVVLFSEDVTIPSSVSADFIDQRLAGTNMAGLGQAFKNAEQQYGVNAIFLTGLAIHESDYGRSHIAQAKNNLFGFMAYDSSPFSSAGYFNSFEDGIDHVARYLSVHYLRPGGQFYSGTSISAINVRYASDQGWAMKIMQRIRTFLNN